MVRIEKLRLALEAAAERGVAAVRMTARSNFAKSVESSAGVAATNGEFVGVGSQYAGVGIMPAVLQRFAGEFAPGDIYVTNDPYIGAGHLPHLDAVRPVFFEGELIAFAVASGHLVDMGGLAPGSMSAAATDQYQEGLYIPLLRLYERDRPNATIHQVIEHNVRAPEVVLGDIQGLVAALRQIELEVAGIARRIGSAAAYRQAAAALLDASAEVARSILRGIPDGVGEWTETVDYDNGLSEPLAIKVRIEKSAEELNVDFTGTSAQVPRAINATLATTQRLARNFVLQVAAGGELPHNTAIFRSVRVTAPAGCVLNPRPPAATGARSVSLQAMFSALLGAMSSIAPERVTADSPGHEAAVTMSGTGVDGRSFVHVEQELGSSGASALGDGEDALGNLRSTTGNVSVEQIENEFPIRIEHYRFVRDTGGPGKYRGGLAIERAFRALVDGVEIQLLGSRERSAPWGLHGGHPGAPGARYVERPSGERVDVSATGRFQMNAGDLLVYRTCGSGGFGPPGERDPAAIESDLLNGKITLQHAEQAYWTGRESTDRRRIAR